MAKIHTLEQLDDKISEESSWRMHELTTARRITQQAHGSAQIASLRSGVLILYAHWEGWIKNVSQLYIRYVNTKKYRLEQLSPAFLGNAIKTRIAASQAANQSSVHTDFALFIQRDLSGRATLSENLVRSESNLSSAVLFDILGRLGLEQLPLYTNRAKMIDEELVERRNSIAHGKFLEIDEKDFLDLHANVLQLLQLFTDQVRNAASTERHLIEKEPTDGLDIVVAQP